MQRGFLFSGKNAVMTFEQNVLKGLVRSGLNPDSISSKSPLGIAVSGGADSVALLISLSAIFD